MKLIIALLVILSISLFLMFDRPYFEGKIRSGNYTIVLYNNSSKLNATLPDSPFTGFTDWNYTMYIQTNRMRIEQMITCWHEKMHIDLCSRSRAENKTCKADYEHKIIYSSIPNLLDRDCLRVFL